MSKTKLFLISLLPLSLMLLLLLPRQTAVANPAVPNGDDPIIIFLPVTFRDYCFAPSTDNFSSDLSGWPSGDTGEIIYRYYSNEYNIFHRNNGNWFGVTRSDVWESDKMVQVQGRTASGESVWGFVFGLNDDWSDFYTFEIWPNNQAWYLMHFTSASGWNVVQNGPGASIQPGTGLNTLRIERNQTMANMQFYINGSYATSLAEINGRVGLSGAAIVNNTDIRYDDYLFIPEECPNDDPYTRPEAFESDSLILDRPTIEAILPGPAGNP